MSELITRKCVLRLIQVAFLLFCLAFVLLFYRESKGEIAQILSQSNGIFILLAIVFWQVAILVMQLFSQTVLKCLGSHVAYTFLLSSYINRLPAKYLPGGVWQTVARFHDLAKNSIPKKNISILVLYENLWSPLIAGLIGGVGVYFFQQYNAWGSMGLVVFLLSCFVLPVLLFFKRFKFIFQFKQYLLLIGISVLFWTIASLSFYSYIFAFGILPEKHSFILISSNYLFSWLAGFVSLFAPQGIGVFELVMAEVTQLDVSIQQAIVIIAGFRLVVFTSDLAVYFVAQLSSFRNKITNRGIK
jgi:glycosyltransferase 2 family protein